MGNKSRQEDDDDGVDDDDDQARRRGGQRGASIPSTFNLGEQRSKSALFEIPKNPFLDIDVIQRRSNEEYKQTKHDWKRKLFA